MICIINALIKNKNEKVNPKITLIFKAIENVPYFIPKNKLITENFIEKLIVYTEIINDEYFEFFLLLNNNFGNSYGYLVSKDEFEKNEYYPIEIESVYFNLFMDEFSNSIIFNENEDIIGYIIQNTEKIIYSLNMNYNISKFIFNIQSKGIEFLIEYENSNNNFITPNNNTENFIFYDNFYNKEINITIKLFDTKISDKQFYFKIIPQFINDKDILLLSEFRTTSCDKIGVKICYFYYRSLNDIDIISFSASEDFNLTNKILSFNTLDIGNNDISLEEIQNKILKKKQNQTDSSMKPIFQISISSELIILIEINLIGNVLSNPIK